AWPPSESPPAIVAAVGGQAVARKKPCSGTMPKTATVYPCYGLRTTDYGLRTTDYGLPTMIPELAASYAYCERLARREAANFYPAFRVLPRPQRRAMCALYAFLRV